MRKLLIFGAALVALATLAACSKSDAPQAPQADSQASPSIAAPARKAPEFITQSLKGERVALSDYKGKVLLLDFWATWCPPCQASIPHLDALSQKYKDKGLVVIGMSFDKDPKELSVFAEKNKMTYTIARATEEASRAYNVSSIPRMFVIDREGNIKGDFLGFNEAIGQSIESAAVAALNK